MSYTLDDLWCDTYDIDEEVCGLKKDVKQLKDEEIISSLNWIHEALVNLRINIDELQWKGKEKMKAQMEGEKK